jgi:hypothetical protein
MISTLLAAMTLSFAGVSAAQDPPQNSAQAGQKPKSAVQMIEATLKRYAEAKTLAGKVAMAQTANGVTVKSETELQIEAPSQIYLRQVYQSPTSGATVRFLVSDGKRFGYDRPPGGIVATERTEFLVERGKPRYIEMVTQNGYQQTVQDMFATERLSLVDKSPLIDIAIGRTQDLRDLMGKWVGMKVFGAVKANGQDVTAVVGSYREDAAAPINGSFELYLTADFDIVKYVQKQRFAVPTQPDKMVDVTTIWDSTLKVDGPVNPALFKDVK